MRSLLTLPGAGEPVTDAAVAEQVEIATKYAGYIERQQDEIARHRGQEDLRLPAGLDYRSVRGLSAEVQQKLNLHQPETIGQAARISGITPAAISLLLVHLKRGFPGYRPPAASRRRRIGGPPDARWTSPRASSAAAPRSDRRAAARRRGRSPERLPRAPRQVEPDVQPDGDPRAGADDHASRARRARRAAAPVVAAGPARAGRGQRRRRARHPAGDRPSGLARCPARQQSQEERLCPAGGDRAPARQR